MSGDTFEFYGQIYGDEDIVWKGELTLCFSDGQSASLKTEYFEVYHVTDTEATEIIVKDGDTVIETTILPFIRRFDPLLFGAAMKRKDPDVAIDFITRWLRGQGIDDYDFDYYGETLDAAVEYNHDKGYEVLWYDKERKVLWLYNDGSKDDDREMDDLDEWDEDEDEIYDPEEYEFDDWDPEEDSVSPLERINEVLDPFRDIISRHITDNGSIISADLDLSLFSLYSDNKTFLEEPLGLQQLFVADGDYDRLERMIKENPKTELYDESYAAVMREIATNISDYNMKIIHVNHHYDGEQIHVSFDIEDLGLSE